MSPIRVKESLVTFRSDWSPVLQERSFVYEAFFGLRSRPFNPLPRVDSYVALSPTREALDGLVRCVEQDRGIGVLTSPAGTGKTLVCRLLQAHFADQRRTVLLTTGRFPTRRALLQAILFEMKHPYVGLSEQEARLRLLDLLQSSPAPQNRLLLIVDEAHLLSPKGHEELRTLTDYEVGGVPSVSLVLSGQLELEEALAEPGMNALNQRVGCHVSIEPLTIEESYEYIRERLRSAGNEGLTVFSPEAQYLICNASEGNPRRLNQLCDHSLLLAYAEGTRPVDAAVVRSALLDLRELPLHWNSPLDLNEKRDPNALEAFAQTHSAEMADLTALEDVDGEEDVPHGPTADAESGEVQESSPAAVYEVGGDVDGVSIDQLFQTTQFIVPSDLQRDETSFSQILREPLSEYSGDVLTGTYETTPDLDVDPADVHESSLSPSTADEPPAEISEVEASEEVMTQESIPTWEPEMHEPEDFMIDDPYAEIDRTAEQIAPRRITAPVLPALTSTVVIHVPDEPAAVNSHTEGLAVAEEQILDMVREMSGEIQQARIESAGERSRDGEALSKTQSLRQALSWQFDVVEPESESPAQPLSEPQVETPQSAVQASLGTSPNTEASENASERRYAQLFTRLQKQRRRVEAVMNRERRPSGEARIS